MFVIPARVGAGPSDDGEVVVGNFELWRLGDLNVLGLLLRRSVQSDDWVGEKQAAGLAGDRPFCEQSIHGRNPQLPFPVKTPHEGRATFMRCRPALNQASFPMVSASKAAARRRRCPTRRGIASGSKSE
jgi:hypothetical protein